jgi:DNA repair exonuclease SbcCD ATPase subunit
MEICKQLICPCNGKLYCSPTSLKEHTKTKIHRLWEESREKKDLQKDSTKLQNDKDRLNRVIETLKEEVESYRSKLETCRDKLETLRDKNENLQEENECFRFNNTELEKKYATFIIEFENLKIENEKLLKVYLITNNIK